MAAVKLRGAYKHYGRGQALQQVLENLDMTVSKGTIYGLLGASGCGKTTLLSCIVGRQHLNSGEVWVLGGKPGSKECGVPGSRVGYMPQEVALVGEFTVKGALFYFGWISGMDDKDIEERFHFLSNLLELPPDDSYVKNLSGGQKRRVSFAAALVHSPELLILDEPTVGLDPVLRASIWEHLVEMTANHSVTVIITTHYIEEAAQAHRIGLLRNGKLLAESDPLQLIASLNCSNLEEVFLMLSVKQENSQLQTLNMIADSVLVSSLNQDKDIQELPLVSNSEEKNGKKKLRTRFSGRMRALLTKNFARILRHYGGLFFIVFFPVLELLAYFFAIGGDPRGLKLAIVNEELGNATNCNEYRYHNPNITTLHEDGTCEFTGLSCSYLELVNQVKIYYEDFETALNAAKKGSVTGVLHFSSNFSRQMQARQELGNRVSIKTLEESEVRVHMDMSNFQIKIFLEKDLVVAFIELGEDIMKSCNLSEKLAHLPVRVNDPIFGDDNQNYQIFMAPGLIISMVYFLAAVITATIIITERNEGVWDRSLVAGVTTSEILLSHILSQITCMFVQVMLVLVVSFDIFGLPCVGDMTTMVILVLLQGFCGLCFGFLVSTVFDNLTTANYFSLGSFYPYISLCGMLWPLEGMPKYLRWVAFCLPGTIPIISMRDILERGRNILESSVYSGFLITALWIVLQVSLCLILLKIKNK